MTESDDLGQIIAGCKKGKSGCFSQLVDRYAGRCYGYFYRLTGNKEISDDLLGELFIKLVEKIGSYRGGCFESWLFKIASNTFQDYLRDKQRWGKLLEQKKIEAQQSINSERRGMRDEYYSDDERIDKLQVQLDKLDADTKELILLRFYSRASFKEIAAMRGEPIGTTLSKLHRGLKKLREMMEDR